MVAYWETPSTASLRILWSPRKEETAPQSMRGFVGECLKSASQADAKGSPRRATSASVGRILEQASMEFQPRRLSFVLTASVKSRRPLRRASLVSEAARVVL